ncbi:hypothetical protein ACJX0J_021143, partial [Zea mays]
WDGSMEQKMAVNHAEGSYCRICRGWRLSKFKLTIFFLAAIEAKGMMHRQWMISRWFGN